MVKNVVMWVYKPEAEDRGMEKNIQYVKSELEKLPYMIDSIETLEADLNFTGSIATYYMILISMHQSKEMLDYYRDHLDTFRR